MYKLGFKNKYNRGVFFVLSLLCVPLKFEIYTHKKMPSNTSNAQQFFTFGQLYVCSAHSSGACYCTFFFHLYYSDRLLEVALEKKSLEKIKTLVVSILF